MGCPSCTPGAQQHWHATEPCHSCSLEINGADGLLARVTEGSLSVHHLLPVCPIPVQGQAAAGAVLRPTAGADRQVRYHSAVWSHQACGGELCCRASHLFWHAVYAGAACTVPSGLLRPAAWLHGCHKRTQFCMQWLISWLLFAVCIPLACRSLTASPETPRARCCCTCTSTGAAAQQRTGFWTFV